MLWLLFCPITNDEVQRLTVPCLLHSIVGPEMYCQFTRWYTLWMRDCILLNLKLKMRWRMRSYADLKSESADWRALKFRWSARLRWTVRSWLCRRDGRTRAAAVLPHVCLVSTVPFTHPSSRDMLLTPLARRRPQRAAQGQGQVPSSATLWFMSVCVYTRCRKIDREIELCSLQRVL